MRDKHAAGRPASLGASAADAVLALPRETKRLIMATADAIAIPTALWAALALKVKARFCCTTWRARSKLLDFAATQRVSAPSLGMGR